MNLNKVFLMGRLTADPELRYTQTGTAVADIRLAINRTFRTQSGDQKEDTCYVDVVLWGRQAEQVNKFLCRGRPIFIEGRLKLDSWESRDGEKRQRLRVVAENYQLVGVREDAGRREDGGRREDDGPGDPTAGSRPTEATWEGGSPAGRQAGNRPPPPEEPPSDYDYPDDNLPF
jgi:single-strand DNA-binding protein